MDYVWMCVTLASLSSESSVLELSDPVWKREFREMSSATRPSCPVSPRVIFQTFPGLSVFKVCVSVTAERNEMKAALYAQFNPVKTMQQLIGDRCVLRLSIVGALLIAACC